MTEENQGPILITEAADRELLQTARNELDAALEICEAAKRAYDAAFDDLEARLADAKIAESFENAVIARLRAKYGQSVQLR